TTGLMVNLANIQDDPFLAIINQQPVAQQYLEGSSADIALTINAVDAKQQLQDGFEKYLAESSFSIEEQQSMRRDFMVKQQQFNDRVTSAFSLSLRPLFLTSAGLMAVATIGTLLIRERPLRGGK